MIFEKFLVGFLFVFCDYHLSLHVRLSPPHYRLCPVEGKVDTTWYQYHRDLCLQNADNQDKCHEANNSPNSPPLVSFIFYCFSHWTVAIL
uniref:Secreted protein n=1 Tax=Octopus bimaculoides TaxID=37653 RepID=A0A0L8FGN9_OCTBM